MKIHIFTRYFRLCVFFSKLNLSMKGKSFAIEQDRRKIR